MAAVAEAVAGAVGGLVNSVGGLYDAYKTREAEEKARKEKQKIAKEASEKAGRTYDDIMTTLEGWKQGQYKFATPEMVKSYQETVAGYDPQSMVYDFDKFDTERELGGKTVEDYMDPYTDQILAQVRQDIGRGAAGSGSIWDADMAGALARGEMEKMNELRSEARQEYQADRDFAYKNYADYINNMQKKYDTLANLTSQKINVLGGAIGHDETQESDYIDALVGAMGGKAQSQISQAMFS